MVAQRRWGEAQDAELRRLHAQRLPLNKIYKQMGWAVGTVSAKAKILGLSFDRSQMEAAINASQIDRKALRGQIIDKLYQRTLFNIERMEAAGGEGFKTLVPVGGGEQRTQTLDHVPANDERALANAMASYLGRAEALEKIDQDGGMGEAKGMVGSILNAIRESVAGVPRINPTKGAA